MRPVRLIVCLASLAVAVPAAAAEFPIRGVFGVAPSDCKAAKEVMEGEYVSFDAKASTGEGGAGGYTYVSVKEVSPKRYELVGTCAGLEQPKRRTKRILVVASQDDVTYADQRYKRCKG